MDCWVVVASGPRCKHTKPVVRPVIIDVSYAVNKHRIQCALCKEWVGTLIDVEK